MPRMFHIKKGESLRPTPLQSGQQIEAQQLIERTPKTDDRRLHTKVATRPLQDAHRRGQNGQHRHGQAQPPDLNPSFMMRCVALHV
jgi:hypothetical protein